MRNLIFVILLFLQVVALGQERYFLVSGAEDSESSYQAAVKTDNYIEIDVGKGLLTGVFNKQAFQGFYNVLSTSSGFVKGFNYRLALGYLQRDVVSDKYFNAFTQTLADGTTFYFYPDFLADPSWHFLEVSGDGNTKLRFVRKH